MHSADVALTKARREGRPFRQHSPDLRRLVTHRERLTIDLRAALASGDLVLHHQPIIDDFGTGYSSLAYLQRLPMVTRKIDRSFVTTMLTEPSNSAIVSMVLQLASSLGMGTVAEGVEDDDTLELLIAVHCDRIQGYAIARPMPEEDFRLWLP